MSSCLTSRRGTCILFCHQLSLDAAATFIILYKYAGPYTVTRCRLWRAVSTLSDAIGFKPRKVVRLFNSESGIVSNSLAIHSSANELLTTFTPIKSSTTRSSCSNNGINCSRTRFPNGRVPRFSPYSLKLNVTITPLIRGHHQTHQS